MALFDPTMYGPSVINQPNPNGYDDAIRRRLTTVDQMGQQQNQYASDQANKKQQSDFAAQNAATQSQFNSGQANVSGAPVGAVGGNNSGTYANSPNPRTAQQAIEFAKQAIAKGDTNWYRRCLAFVGSAYGLAGTGTNYAIDAFTRLPAAQQHTDRNPNIGSAVYWRTNGRAGHAALYAGNGMIYSTDIGGNGRIAYVPMSDVEKKWGATYAGWSDPYFASSPRR